LERREWDSAKGNVIATVMLWRIAVALPSRDRVDEASKMESESRLDASLTNHISLTASGCHSGCQMLAVLSEGRQNEVLGQN